MTPKNKNRTHSAPSNEVVERAAETVRELAEKAAEEVGKLVEDVKQEVVSTAQELGLASPQERQKRPLPGTQGAPAIGQGKQSGQGPDGGTASARAQDEGHYDPQSIEQKWSERWNNDPDALRRRGPGLGQARNITSWRCCPIPPARSTWATCATTPSATRWPATCG